LRFQGDTDLGDDALSVLGIECDVAAEQSVQEAFKEVIETFGRVDSVVANAGKNEALFPPRIMILM
jgi:NAD(P)-dependent dehydrogenase (short-subunit alcohol dehydrogenase family)